MASAMSSESIITRCREGQLSGPRTKGERYASWRRWRCGRGHRRFQRGASLVRIFGDGGAFLWSFELALSVVVAMNHPYRWSSGHSERRTIAGVFLSNLNSV